MAKKKKVVALKKTAGDSRLPVNDDAYQPFKDIDRVVPEKLREPAPKKVVAERKEPKVVGYDPHANFGDILSDWEATGELSGVTKRMKSESKVVVEKSFADIFAEWEGVKVKSSERKTEPVKKSKSYVPQKSFSDILDQYDGIKPKKKKILEEPVKKSVVASKVAVSTENIRQALEDKQAADLEKPSNVSWSFADTYRKWNEVSDEQKALEQSKKEKRGMQKESEAISKLRSMEPQATLDLHGMIVTEAENACATFINDSAEKKLQKICIIPGKGLHNDSGVSLLKEVVLSQIRLSGVVREAYSPKACFGGSGAIWIILKAK
ncbi:Smr/MutS family protein [uncultured Sphaerochaeta sp.]|uniref:Smr/MutS family protein n=1 Tax=uncultured Sphaerochaeta sp. TaxID=886478 RepID=UPI002A0A48EF|nr:Smr/MutS family protein [uncultured Sphaerochaeta sp.]